MAPTPLVWPLLPDEEPLAPTGAAAAEVAAATAERGQLAFLGFGILRPFRRDEKNDFANAGGLRLLDVRLSQLLATKADSTAGPGELPWRTEFGSRLHILRHRNNSDALSELAAVIVAEAVERWEKNVVVVDVTAERVSVKGSPRERTLLVRLTYKIVDQSGADLTTPRTIESLVR
jgi:phage baseplate assembly protein W